MGLEQGVLHKYVIHAVPVDGEEADERHVLPAAAAFPLLAACPAARTEAPDDASNAVPQAPALQTIQ